MEIYQHKVEMNGEAYMTFQRGKHRGMPPLVNSYVVYQFNKDRGYIDDDVLGPDMSRKRVAAAPASGGGDNAWFDMAA